VARERKALIEPGSLLPAADTLLERILERDRQAAGRTASVPIDASLPEKERNTILEPQEDSSSSEENITSNITAHIPAQHETKPRRQASTQQGRKTVRQKDSKVDSRAEAKTAEQQSRLTDRQGYAQALSATRAIPITLRLPEGLNDWLDEYAHLHRKQGVKKQDLIARAVELLVLSLHESDEDAQD